MLFQPRLNRYKSAPPKNDKVIDQNAGEKLDKTICKPEYRGDRKEDLHNGSLNNLHDIIVTRLGTLNPRVVLVQRLEPATLALE